MTYNTLIPLLGTGILGLAIGVVGTFAVLRRRALIGDALGHATLPGLWLAYMATGARNLPVLLLGAFVTGVLGVLVIGAVKRWSRLREDVGIALVLSVFFGAGVTLKSLQQGRHGSGTLGLDSFILGSTATINRDDVVLLGIFASASVLLVAVLYKEIALTAFDAGFARVQGWPAARLDFLLLLLVTVVVIIGLPAVGVLLSAALLVILPAAARFWTQRLSVMLILSGSLGLFSGILGTLLSATFSSFPAGPTIVLTATSFFMLSYFVGPHGGWLARRRALRLYDQHHPTGIRNG
jgi:manganese/zinc/iron transport system permease protein